MQAIPPIVPISSVIPALSRDPALSASECWTSRNPRCILMEAAKAFQERPCTGHQCFGKIVWSNCTPRSVVTRWPLVTHGANGLTANFIPFTLTNEDGRDNLRAHMARANGQIEDLLTGAEALVIFQGPQAYITPSWYATKMEHEKVVPTWNYIVVQVRGNPRIIEDANWLRAQIDTLTTLQEADRSAPWSVNDAPEDYIDALLKNIIGFEIPIERIEGKWKVSQNQPTINRASVVAGLREIDPTSSMAAIIDQQK